MQEPGQRAPERPEPTPETQPSSNPVPPGSRPSSPEAGQAPPVETFVGIIDKQSDSYVLLVSGRTSYRLDNGQELEPYAGRRVRITGSLDQAINLIRVEKVEVLPDETHPPS